MKTKTGITAIVLLLSFIAIVFYIYRTGVNLSTEQEEALRTLVLIAFGTSIYCIIASELTGNYSQVDRLWSLMPVVYAWVIASYDNFEFRSLLCAILVSIWGLRLSYNFALKGGYHWLPWKGEEDYRWAHLRKEGAFSNRWVWMLFNIFFISFYQMGLILYFSIPMILFLSPDELPLNIVDLIAALFFCFFLVIESVADWQQYRFQKEKYRLIKQNIDLPEPYDKGFIRTGLWSIVRHPNYMAEQMIWLCVYAFGVSASGQHINWTFGGVLLLILLFKGSSDFSERISSTKYPAYQDYIRKVPRFIPWMKP